MQDNRHPFERLPTHLRQTPPIVDAWLIDLSRQSSRDTPRQEVAQPNNETVRMLILGVLLLTAAGIIKPEVLLKFLPILVRASLGVGA